MDKQTINKRKEIMKQRIIFQRQEITRVSKRIRLVCWLYIAAIVFNSVAVTLALINMAWLYIIFNGSVVIYLVWALTGVLQDKKESKRLTDELIQMEQDLNNIATVEVIECTLEELPNYIHGIINGEDDEET